MKTKFFATMLLAGGALLAQAPQYGQNGAPQQPQYADPNYQGPNGYYDNPNYQDQNGYYDDQAPPEYAAPAPPVAPPSYAAAPPAPGPGYIWVDPYWNWVGGRYAFVSGYWTLPPYAGAYWIGSRYYSGHFYGGYWGRSRGGVVVHNYGYGYRGGNFGRGYVAQGQRATGHTVGQSPAFGQSRAFRQSPAVVQGHATTRGGGRSGESHNRGGRR